jgi:chemotaxis protein methyltransferase CheR
LRNGCQTPLCREGDPFYGHLKKHLIARTGLAYYDDRDDLLAETIGRRLSELGLRDCFTYAELLADASQGSAEMDALIAQLTVGETYFFRDSEQFDALRRVVLPDILDRKQSSRQLHIWSAGCANGAEPYSLAILLGRELAYRIAGWEVSIFATDINQRSLAEAQEGKFHAWALRATSEEVKRDCFSSDGRVWTIHPEYKEWISFAPLNLVECEFSSPRREIAGFDLILCRNVMIYFGAEVNRRLIRQFYASLAGNGWFLVGATEHNPENFTAFRAVTEAGATVYQKREQQAPQTSATATCPLLPLPLLPPLAPITARPASGPPAGPRDTLGCRDIDGLRQLVDRGDWKSALQHCQGLFAQESLNPVVYFYHALVLDKMGVPAEAERSFRQAIYLDRNFAMAHYHLGLALKRQEDPPRAGRSFANVLKLLSDMRDEQIVLDGAGVTVAGLRKLAAMHLENLGCK